MSPALAWVAAATAVLVAWGAAWIELHDLTRYTYTALAHGGVYLVGVWWVVTRGVRRRDLALILLVAVLLRGLAMSAPMNLSTDALRYVWDGRVQLAGVNPYLYPPADERLTGLRDAAIYPGINQKETAVTIYPPVAQMIFALAALLGDGLASVRLVMVAFEALTVAAVLAWLRADGLPRERVLIYAWHPLPIWELAAQAHIDAAATALLMLAIVAVARRRQGLAGALLAGAALTKYFPVVLIPALWRRFSPSLPAAFAATAVALYIPYWIGAGPKVLGFLFNHLGNEGYRDGYGFHGIWLLRDFAIADPPAAPYIAGAIAILAALAVVALVGRRADEVRPAHLLMLGAAFVWLTSPHYPWYFAWLVPLLCRLCDPAVLGLTLLAVLLNLPGDQSWQSFSTVYIAIFGGFLLLLAAAALARAVRGRRGLTT